MNNSITIKTTILSYLTIVWDCYTMPEHIINWNFASQEWCCPTAINDLKVNGLFNYRMEAKDGLVGFDFCGYYTEVVDKHLIRYTMGKPIGEVLELARKVEVKFQDLCNNTTQVTVIFEIENENSLELQQSGWQSIIDNFKQYTEKHSQLI
jgi:uncharacterized protein YndB with AHSA1/START domain